MMPHWLRCPRCQGLLGERDRELRCARCGHVYPVVDALPDLRVAPDLWLDFEDDRRKGLRVDAESPPGFAAALTGYWAATPATPPRLVARYVEHALRAESAARSWLARLVPDGARGETWLDVGCGTGGLLCAAPEGVTVAGLDVAFRWLVVARRRLRERGVAAPLVCGNAESLPVADAAFDRLFLAGVVEHCADLGAVLAQARRVLRPGGRLHLRSVNRFSLLSEPHVGLWGVGWLPRRHADRYVRWRGGAGYTRHWPPSARQLERGLAGAGFDAVRVGPAAPLAGDRDRLPARLRWLAAAYADLHSLASTRRALRAVAPLLEATAVAP